MAKLKCPKCRAAELTRLSVQLADVDQCPECEGVWFDNSAPELLDVLRAGEEHLPGQLQRSLNSDQPRLATTPDHKYICPRCHAEMRSYWYGGETVRSFLVDGCTRGCGFWLDDGELGQAYALLKGTRPAGETEKTSAGILNRVGQLRQSRGESPTTGHRPPTTDT